MTRLRRADCSGPGITRRRRGRRLRLPRQRDRRADRRPRDARARARARHPAGLEGRVDLPVPERPPAGHGDRRRGPQAVPLPRRLADPPRRGEVRGHDPLRQGAAEAARAGRGRPRRHRPADARTRAGLCDPPARPRLLPRRHRGVHGVLRPGHDPQAPRAHRRRPDGLRLHRQERPAPDPGGRRPARAGHRVHAQAAPRRRAGAARLQERPPVVRPAQRRHQRLPEGEDRR